MYIIHYFELFFKELFRFIIIQEGMNTSKIGYDIFCKLFEKNLVKLNLTACENSKISLKIPIVITENLDKLNSSNSISLWWLLQ